jgi:GDP-4-dehydro-6-deoxy-D-mannose reductase
MADILVTGADGFIGRALCQALRSDGHSVVALTRRDGDIASAATLGDLPAAGHVFHLAARSFIPDSWNDPRGMMDTNVVGTANVLDYCRRSTARLTFVSTCVYGVPTTLPISEDCPPRPNNPYALSKYLGEQLCEFHAAHHGLQITTLRAFNVFGPGQNRNFLVAHVLEQVLGGRKIKVNNLSPRRDYLYIDDFIPALLRTLHGPHGGYDVFNVGSGSSVSVKEVVDVMQSVAGTELPVDCAGAVRPNEIDDVYADVGKARRLLGWEPRLSFREGVGRLVGASVRNRPA